MKKRFSDFKIGTKLIVLTGIFLITLIILGFVTELLFKSSQTVTILVNQERVFVENFESGIEHFYKYEISGNENELKQSKEHLQKAITIAYVFSKIDTVVREMPRADWKPYLFDIYKEGVDFDKSKVELMVNQIKLFSKINPEMLKEIQTVALEASVLGREVMANITDYSLNKSPEKLAELQHQFDDVHEYTRIFSSKLYFLSDYMMKLLYLIIIILVVLLGTVVTFISVLISRTISKPINKLAENFKKIAKGNLKTSVKIDSDNEIGDLSKAFFEIQVGLQNIISHTKKVAEGDYSARLTPNSEDDELTPALNLMAVKLEETKLRTEKESWLQKGINDLVDRMRGNFSVRELSERIITYLSSFLRIEMGAVYVYDEVLEHLELTGSIGINTSEIKEIVKRGEGLIGNAAMQDTLQIIDTKNKFQKVYCAIGEMTPEKLYLLPMHFDNRIQAVIELAPVNILPEIKIEFLKMISKRVSVNLGAAVARFRNKELLDQSLEQVEILKARHEELSRKLEENQRIQENLSRETALLNSMLKTLPDYVYFKDTESKFLRISESMVDLFHAKNSNEIIGKSDFDFHMPKDAKRYYNEEQEIIKKGEGFIDEVRQGIDEDGDELWTSVTKLPMYDENGNCLGTFGISKNVTNIKKLEVEVKLQNDQLVTKQEELTYTIEEMNKIQSELKREKALMDSLLNNLPDAVYFKDRESKFIKVSKSMPELFNLEKQEDLYGKSDFDFFDEEHALPAYQTEQEIIKTKTPVIGLVEKEVYKDGSVKYVSSTKMPLLNEKGEAVGTFGISRDITKIKELEIEIKERNEKLNEQQEELQIINDHLKQQQEELKATNEEINSQGEELRVANEELAEQTKVLAESEKSLQVQQEELKVANEELEAKTGLLEIQKREIIAKNINLTKIQEDLKQKARELELASKYKSEFLTNMSHELRTPLNSLLILSKLLGNNKNGNLTPEQVKSVNIIHKSGKDLLDLINEILDLSKIEAGKMNYNFSEVVSDDIISEIRINFHPVAENKELTMEIIPNDFHRFVSIHDRQRLMQIIKNLLSNAFKFTRSGGITVNMGIPSGEVKYIKPELNNENTYFISVKDSGVGIPQGKVDAIFEAFQQADGSISRKFGGTGLGLSISKQLTRVLGGEIHVKSTEGVGSIFTIYLPLDKDLVGKESSENNFETDSKVNSEKKELTKEIENNDLLIKAKEIEIPFFIEDDRNSEMNRIVVLIIHNKKEKAKKLVEQCHRKKFAAIAAANIFDGIKLAEKYVPQAVIISAGLNDSKDIKDLKMNKFTARLPLHFVSRIEDFVLDNIKEFHTPESEDFQINSKNIESKLNKEYRQVLVVEDDPATRIAIQLLFENKEIIIHEAKTGNQAYEMISTQPFDCIILDLGLPDFSGYELLEKLNANNIPVPNVIINTARELSGKELRELQKYSDSIVIKGVKSDERLMDEVTLFLHQVKNTLPKKAYLMAQEENENPGFKGKKVLVVDDDIRNVFAIAQILEEREIEILEAENGEVAIEVLKNNADIDLVLMDIMMPVMDGFEATKEIRRIESLDKNRPYTPIIAFTANTLNNDHDKCVRGGMDDILEKPFHLDKFRDILKNLE